MVLTGSVSAAGMGAAGMGAAGTGPTGMGTALGFTPLFSRVERLSAGLTGGASAAGMGATGMGAAGTGPRGMGAAGMGAGRGMGEAGGKPTVAGRPSQNSPAQATVGSPLRLTHEHQPQQLTNNLPLQGHWGKRDTAGPADNF